jgi:hypothetical protein
MRVTGWTEGVHGSHGSVFTRGTAEIAVPHEDDDPDFVRLVLDHLAYVEGRTPERTASAILARGAEAAAGVPVPGLDREALGRLVHETRLACEAERSAAEGRVRFVLGSWEERSDHQRELDMRIGEAVAAAERERADRPRAKLAAIADLCREKCVTLHDGPRVVQYTRTSDILAIIASEASP